MVTVQVWDATGNKRQEVEMPDDAPVNRILAVLLEKMNFPPVRPRRPAAQLQIPPPRLAASNCWTRRRSRDVGVKDGDVLRLQPEITAGGRPA